MTQQNVLVTNRKTYWEYIVGGESYYVPNLGHQFLLGDFGLSFIKNKLETNTFIKERGG
jgi:hypothetical protein